MKVFEIAKRNNDKRRLLWNGTFSPEGLEVLRVKMRGALNPMANLETASRVNGARRGVAKGVEFRAKASASVRRRIARGERWLWVRQAPNKLEQRVQAHLDFWFPGKWRFNNRQFVGRMVPDFIHVGNSALLEVFGDYWHAGENPAERISAYRAHGHACAVVWEGEYRKDPFVLFQRVREVLRVGTL